MGGGRWEEEEEEEKEAGGSFIFRHPNNLVGGLWPRAGSHPLPPSFLSAACYYSEATTFFFLISWLLLIVDLVLSCAHGVGQGYQGEA